MSIWDKVKVKTIKGKHAKVSYVNVTGEQIGEVFAIHFTKGMAEKFKKFRLRKATAIFSLYVDKEYRGEGWGSIMLWSVTKDKGRYLLIADKRESKTIHKYYEAFGFEKLMKTKNGWMMTLRRK
jgi:GNAT superfamily N-acetyltransferase